MELKDFVTKIGTTLDQFVTKPVDSEPVTNEVSSSHLAIHTATINGVGEEDRAAKFLKYRQDLSMPGGLKRYAIAVEEARRKLDAGNKSSLEQVIVDTTIPADERALIVQTNIDSPPHVTEYEAIAEKALSTDSEPDDGERQERSRDALAAHIRAIQASNFGIQQLINTAVVADDPEFDKLLGAVADIAEMVAPFAENRQVWNILEETGLAEAGAYEELTGELKHKLFSVMAQLTDPTDRLKWAQVLVKVVKNNKQFLIQDQNSLQMLNLLSKALESGEYSEAERIFDDVLTGFDVVGVGSLIKGGVKSASRLAGLSGDAKNIERLRQINANVNSYVTHRDYEYAQPYLMGNKPSPVSIGQNVATTNPAQARNMLAATALDTTDETALAVYGTTRESALAHNLLPEGGPAGAPIPPSTGTPIFGVDADLQTDVRLADILGLPPKETQDALDNVSAGLRNVDGMDLDVSKSRITREEDGTISIHNFYAPRDGVFSSPEEAIQNFLYAFRNYDIPKENILLYIREGDHWIEGAGKTGTPTGYAAGIKFVYTPNIDDVPTLGFLDTKRNWFEYLPKLFKGIKGTKSGWIFPPDSSLHQIFTIAANNAADKVGTIKRHLTDLAKDFAIPYSKLSRSRQNLMRSYIEEANLKGIRASVYDLANRGFNKAEINILSRWRKVNDQFYHLNNQDLIKNLTNWGYKTYIDVANNTKLFIRELGRRAVGGKIKVFDSSTGKIVTLDVKKLDDLYNSGGNVGKTGHPLKVGDEWVSHVLNRNSPTSGYARVLSRTDSPLSYREGWYHTGYTDEFFIRKVVDSKGAKHTITLASARNVQDAKKLVDNLQGNHKEEVFFQKAREKIFESKAFDDDETWGATIYSGKSSQKIRGERLGDINMPTHNVGSANIVDPLDSVGQQIESLSQHIAMRGFFTNIKKRFIRQFEVLGMPKDKIGNSKYPASMEDLQNQSGLIGQKMLADARYWHGYIEKLEDQYVNAVDKTWQLTMNLLADTIGDSMTASRMGEAFFRWLGDTKPTKALRMTAFKLYIAVAPLRHAIIQRIQTIQLIPLHPSYVLNPAGLPADVAKFTMAALGHGSEEWLEAAKWFKRSGMDQIVSSNSFLRDAAVHLADVTWYETAKNVGLLPVNIAQKVGFEMGERDVLVTSWLTFRNLAKKQGMSMSDPKTYEWINGQARSYTLQMNKAGEPSYHESSLGFIMQFFQVGHKALLQPFTNRMLTPIQKIRLGLWNLTMYGVPSAAVVSWVNSTDLPPEAKQIASDGLMDYAFNNGFLAYLTEDDSAVDIQGSFAPYNTRSMYTMMMNLLTGDLPELLNSAPSTRLFFGANSRMTNMWRNATRYFGLVDDYDDPRNQTKFTDVLKASAQMFSGFSSGFKARYAMKTGKMLNSRGDVVDPSVTMAESIFILFGVTTKTEAENREFLEKYYGSERAEFNTDPVMSDINTWWESLTAHIASQGVSNEEFEFQSRVLSEVWRGWGDQQWKVKEILKARLATGMENNDDKFLDMLANKIGLWPPDRVWEYARSLPENYPGKQQFLESLEHLDNIRENLEGTE